MIQNTFPGATFNSHVPIYHQMITGKVASAFRLRIVGTRSNPYDLCGFLDRHIYWNEASLILSRGHQHFEMYLLSSNPV